MDPARAAAQSDPERNPQFNRRWSDDLPPLPRPFVSLGTAMERVVREIERKRHETLIKEVFGQ